MAWAAKGDLARAIADYSRTIELKPNEAAAYYNRGLAKQRRGDIPDGDADVAAARKLNPRVGR